MSFYSEKNSLQINKKTHFSFIFGKNANLLLNVAYHLSEKQHKKKMPLILTPEPCHGILQNNTTITMDKTSNSQTNPISSLS